MEPSRKRLGLFGGTFNPPHVAHLLLAQEAWYRLELARVEFIVAGQNPLKDDPRAHATDEQRLEMAKLAVREDARFSVDARELRRGGPSYTIDTLMYYAEHYPDWELYLLMGADAALSLPEWKDIRLYGGLCTIVFCNRPGEDDLRGGLPEEFKELGLRWEFMPLPPLDLSSTEIRKRLRMGKPVRYFVADSVAEYIHQNGIYR